MNRETAAKGDQTTVLGWHRGEGGLLVGEAERVGVDLSPVSLKLMLFLLATKNRGSDFGNSLQVPISNCSPGEGGLLCFVEKYIRSIIVYINIYIIW